MQIFNGESDLKGTKWCEEDVINLQTRLTDEEFEATITDIMLDMDRLKACAMGKALPARYMELVTDYAGSSKADPDIEINL